MGCGCLRPESVREGKCAYISWEAGLMWFWWRFGVVLWQFWVVGALGV